MRHVSRMFVVGAILTVPFACVVLRKGYGLGAQAMAGAASAGPSSPWPGPPASSAAWASRGRCASASAGSSTSLTIPSEREAAFAAMVARAYEHGKALNVAAHFEIDDVIDPAHTRARFVHALDAAGPPGDWTAGQRRPFVDTW